MMVADDDDMGCSFCLLLVDPPPRWRLYKKKVQMDNDSTRSKPDRCPREVEEEAPPLQKNKAELQPSAAA